MTSFRRFVSRLRGVVALLLTLFLAGACATTPPGDGPGQPGTITREYLPDHSVIRNPERGFHRETDLVNNPRFDEPGVYSLARSYVRLDAWRAPGAELPQSLLDDLDAGFAAARTAGVKIVLRFSYNFGPPDADDAPLANVLRHLEQLTPVLERNADVIAVLQAGFIGRWGEWHQSTNGLTSNENKWIITNALLAALPAERMVQIRAPFHMMVRFPDSFDPALAFSSAGQARVGFKNDCFLAGHNDIGTFRDGAQFDGDVEYAYAMAPFTVTGGETCAVEFDAPISDVRRACDNAIGELAAFGWDYLNEGYYRPVINGWIEEGCYDEIASRLGYRYELVRATAPARASAGGRLDLALVMRNSGFGKLYNPRPLEIVLEPVVGGTPVVIRAAEDARLLLPLAGGSETLNLSLNLPAGMASGQWRLLLSLPDAAPNLAADPRYSIRLAATATDGSFLWREDTGYNDLLITINID